VGLKSRATEGPSIKSGQIWYDPIIDRLVLLEHFGYKDHMVFYFEEDRWCYLLAVYLDRLIYIGDL